MIGRLFRCGGDRRDGQGDRGGDMDNEELEDVAVKWAVAMSVVAKRSPAGQFTDFQGLLEDRPVVE